MNYKLQNLMLFRCLFLFVTIVLLSVQGGFGAVDEPVEKLPPYVVSATPFGYIGIKRGTVVYNFWRLVSFRNSVLFVRIEEIYPDSPAAKAGVVTGDQITSINGIPIGKWSMHQLRRFGNELEVGQKISAEIRHPADLSVRTVEVTVEKKGKEPPPESRKE